MVRKISGKSKSASYHHLNTNFNDATSDETKSTTKTDIADTVKSLLEARAFIRIITLL